MIKLIHFQPASFGCYDENPDHWPMQRTTGLLAEVPQRSKIKLFRWMKFYSQLNWKYIKQNACSKTGSETYIEHDFFYSC